MRCSWQIVNNRLTCVTIHMYVCICTCRTKDSPAVLPGASALHLIEQNFNKREASSDRSFKFSLYCTTRQKIHRFQQRIKCSRISYRKFERRQFG